MELEVLLSQRRRDEADTSPNQGCQNERPPGQARCDGPEGDKRRRRSGEEADRGQGPEGLAGPATIEVDPINNRQDIQDMGPEEGVASKDTGGCHLQTIKA